jgi:hypothetical protein
MLNRKQCVSFLKKILATSISKLIEMDEMKKNEIIEENEYNKLLSEVECLNKMLSTTEEYLKLI